MVEEFPAMFPATFKEARQHPRVEHNGRCWLESGKVTLYAPLGNVSEGGAFLRTGVPLAPGDRARLRFQLDERVGAPLEVEAVVVWKRELDEACGGSLPGMGLRFVALGERETRTVRGFVAHRLKPS